MTAQQMGIFIILIATMVLFVWGRWRFDMVAMMALFACILLGIVKPDEAFHGFGHPAVITVIAVLAITRAFANSGLVDLITSHLARLTQDPFTQLVALCGIAAGLSAFINNVGALALLMPVAIATAQQSGYSASQLLMPMSFASILGGLSTLIGTPPNIIIAHYRGSVTGDGFGMFDFTPVGLTLALAGVVFIVLIGRRLIPRHRQGRADPEELFEVSDYLTEIRIREGSNVIGKSISEFETLDQGHLAVLGLFRDERRVAGYIRLERLQAGDILLVQGPSSALEDLVEKANLELVASEKRREDLHGRDIALMEAVVAPRAWVVRRTPASLRLRSRYRVNLLAVARQGRALKQRLRDIRLQAGDVLLLQGEADSLPEVITALGCLPLASRGLKFQPQRVLLPVAIFGMAVIAIAVGWLPAGVALMGAVGGMILTGLLPLEEVYDSVDWPIIVLLGAMIPVGGALEHTGATAVIANVLIRFAGDASPLLILGLIIVITMTLSDIMNNAATSVIMAPLAVGIAQHIGVNADPFLMAVAVGASSAFLTPIGHQNNTLVMGPGGYRFGDYWRLGLPLEILLVVMAVPLIAWVWPL